MNPENTPQHSKPLKSFDEAIHHPFVEGVKHLTSPLSAALLIFGVHKAWQKNAFVAWGRARNIVKKQVRPL